MVNSVMVVVEKGETVGLLGLLQNGGVLSLSKAGKPLMVILVCEDECSTITTYNS
ncbi:MAG: hypothetical protein IIA61_03800 [Candidatus Marinimicrobia bacterium]|nr:hypothetical protein [Candidatus Neomarinimicrobiota bacterium]